MARNISSRFAMNVLKAHLILLSRVTYSCVVLSNTAVLVRVARVTIVYGKYIRASSTSYDQINQFSESILRIVLDRDAIVFNTSVKCAAKFVCQKKCVNKIMQIFCGPYYLHCCAVGSFNLLYNLFLLCTIGGIEDRLYSFYLLVFYNLKLGMVEHAPSNTLTLF